MERGRIENKMKEIIDWENVAYHIKMIEVYLKETIENQLDYTGEIRVHLEQLENIFHDAEDAAAAALEDLE